MTTKSFTRVSEAYGLDLSPASIGVLQVNITQLCNQTCAHCHVDASPLKSGSMDRAIIERCLDVLAEHDEIATLDVTGGAPELHPDFEYFASSARALGKRVLVRHNLTVTIDPHPLTGESMAHLPELFARLGLEVIASLPCYLRENTDRQRGVGVFDKSIESLRLLNAEGYGLPGSNLRLDIAHNPMGPSLPDTQCALENDYRRALTDGFGIHFNHLFALANMPVNRFDSQLAANDGRKSYIDRLMAAYNPAAALGAMCRSQVSVGWDGRLYDCDFNQALGLAIGDEVPTSVSDFDAEILRRRDIRFAEHCFGCTAGAGSSCCGATT